MIYDIKTIIVKYRIYAIKFSQSIVSTGTYSGNNNNNDNKYFPPSRLCSTQNATEYNGLKRYVHKIGIFV